MKHKIVSSAFALLVVTSMFAMPMNQVSVVGTASASHDCDTTDAAVAAITFTYVNKDKCLNNHVDHAVEEVRNYEKNKTKIDLYSSANTQKAQNDVYSTTYDNYLQDTDSVAWNKAEVAIAETYEEGGSKAEAKVAAREAIANYYSVKQQNLKENWNTSAVAFNYIDERAEQEGMEGHTNDSLSMGYSYTWDYTRGDFYTVDSDDGTNTGYPYNGGDSEYRVPDYTGNINETVSLVNGTEATTMAYQFEVYSESNGTMETKAIGVHDGVTKWNPHSSLSGYETDGEITFEGMMVERPNDNYDNLRYITFEDYAERWNKIESKNEELQNESDAFVDATWQDYQDGNIDSTDVISRNTMMFEYGTSASSGNGTYYDAIGAAAGMGLDTPELNGTGQMQITIPASGSTYDGLVFARNAPNNTWESGRTYDPDNIEGPVMVATTDGELFEVSREFTIDSMVDKSGEEQTSVKTTNYNYKTADTSDLHGKYDRLLNLTQELENRSQSVGTGGSGETDSDPKVPEWLTEKYGGIPLYGIIAIGLALAYVVASVRKP